MRIGMLQLTRLRVESLPQSGTRCVAHLARPSSEVRRCLAKLTASKVTECSPARERCTQLMHRARGSASTFRYPLQNAVSFVTSIFTHAMMIFSEI